MVFEPASEGKIERSFLSCESSMSGGAVGSAWGRVLSDNCADGSVAQVSATLWELGREFEWTIDDESLSRL